MARVERTELVRGGEERDVDTPQRHRAVDIVAEIAVLALGQHPHAGAWAAIERRRLSAYRQRFEEGVKAAGILEAPAYPAIRSEEPTSALQSLMAPSYAVVSRKKTNKTTHN